jgi:hypothetical protein
LALFFAAVCPGKCGVPPGRCPPCPTLSQSKRCAASSCTWLCRPRGRLVFRPICGVHAVRCLGCVFLGVFLPNRVRKVENMSLFFGPGLLYTTRGWGLRPGGVLVGSLTCCRSYSCGGGSVPCLAVCRWALLVGVSLLGKKACVFVQIEESVVTVFDCTWACKEAEQQAQWQQGGAW